MPKFRPPNPNDRLREVIDIAKYEHDAQWKWNKQLYDDITMGDLMRLSGWMRMKAGKEDPTVSEPLKRLTATDFQNLAKILEDHTGMTYGHSVYFCCSCT